MDRVEGNTIRRADAREGTAANTGLPVAVLADATQWTLLRESGLSYGALLPLTPEARAAVAAEQSRAVLRARDGYTDGAYADAIRTLHEGRAQFDAALRHEGIGAAGRWVAVYAHQAMVNAALRLAATLAGDGPWLVPCNGRFVETVDREEAIACLLRAWVDRYGFVGGWHGYRAPPLRGLFALLRDGVARAAAAGRGTRYVSQRTDHPFGLTRALERTEPPARLLHVTRTETGWLEYARLARELVRALRGATAVQLRAVAAPVPDMRARLDRAVAALPDPVARRAMGEVASEVAASAALVEGMVSDFERIVRRAAPDLMLTYEVADGFTAALAEACGRAGVPRMVMNHNLHAPPLGETDDLAMEYFFTIQHPPHLTDEFVMWSRPGAAVARRYLPAERTDAVRPIRRAPIAVGAPGREGRPRHVLHAGNAQRWMTFFPWTFETADEYVDGLCALAEAMTGVDGAELVIRTKGKPEPGNATLAALLPHPGTWTLRERNDIPFDQDLAAADLMVSNMSSTIMQAIQSRVPVLLWGGGLRALDLGARTEPPVAGDRAAVYTVTRAGDLAAMIRAILDAHAGAPLTDDEIAPYVWPPEAPDVDTLAAAIAAGDYRNAWNEGSTP